MTTNAEGLVKIGPVVAEIFGGICQFLPLFAQFYKNFLNAFLKHPSY